MPKKVLPVHVQGLLKYLAHPTERANEDLAVGFFRHLFKDDFSRQSDASRADGYVAGTFVLELKGARNDWYQGLLQGLAYHRDLDFTLIVVAAHQFLSVWRVEDLPNEIVDYVLGASGAPSTLGREAAKRFAKQKQNLLGRAAWHLSGELFEGLFVDSEAIADRLDSLEATLRSGRRERTRITTKTFSLALKQMSPWFDEPLKAVRAFYSMLFSWKDGSRLELSVKTPSHASLGGERLTHIRPAKARALKQFVDQHVVHLGEGENYDDFFAKYDVALDTVDPGFRTRNGIFFTDLSLSKFVLWVVKKTLNDLDVGKNYLVIDPACGSGNLVTNWRSPLQLRHKVVSEIEPELLFAIERRMQGDAWHHGKFTVVPRVTSGDGLNFLDKDAATYLQVLNTHLEEKGHSPNRPLAFLCNPPFRNDDDQATEGIAYDVHKTILDLTGNDASVERYLCFLAQMKLICRAAKESGRPGESLLLIFTKTGWLTDRPVSLGVRREILGAFKDEGGVMVNSKEFFKVKGRYPIAFSIWRYSSKEGLSQDRLVPLLDLTWLKRSDLQNLPWDDDAALDVACNALLADKRTIAVPFGVERDDIATWSGATRIDFQREKTTAERAQTNFVCGLPTGDSRHERKKTLGHADGSFVGFMDELTPCRIRRNPGNGPWFRLDKPVMDARRARCLSGPPDQKGFTPATVEQAIKLFTWYGIQRVFSVHPYPMWADALEYWPPNAPPDTEKRLNRDLLVLGLAENECVETLFPANNPVKGAPLAIVGNPMSPADRASYWSTKLASLVQGSSTDSAGKLLQATLALYRCWGTRFKTAPTLHANFSAQYFVGGNDLMSRNAGVLQMAHYATEHRDESLIEALGAMQACLKIHKEKVHEVLLDPKGINYFGASKASQPAAYVPRTSFDATIERRLALASTFVVDLYGEKYFGRTKLAKLFYLADAVGELDLATNYEREAAGPLDKRALYNSKYGIEAVASRCGYFVAETVKAGSRGDVIRYRLGPNIKMGTAAAQRLFGPGFKEVLRIRSLFKGLDTEQCEIVATLYASWNDLLLRHEHVEDEEVVEDVRMHWHERKQRFTSARLLKALTWMRENHLVPTGRGTRTRAVRTVS